MDIPRAFRRPSLLIKLGIAEEKPQKGLYVHVVIPSILLHWTLSVFLSCYISVVAPLLSFSITRFDRSLAVCTSNILL